MSRVAHMVCPYCARMHGSEHVSGCPITEPEKPAAYLDGWLSARNGLLPPLADEIESSRAQALASSVMVVQLWEFVADDGAEEAALRAVPGLADLLERAA